MNKQRLRTKQVCSSSFLPEKPQLATTKPGLLLLRADGADTVALPLDTFHIQDKDQLSTFSVYTKPF